MCALGMHEYVRGCAGVGSAGAITPSGVRFAPTAPCVPTPSAPIHAVAKRVFEVVGWGVEKHNAHELQVAEA